MKNIDMVQERLLQLPETRWDDLQTDNRLEEIRNIRLALGGVEESGVGLVEAIALWNDGWLAPVDYPEPDASAN